MVIIIICKKVERKFLKNWKIWLIIIENRMYVCLNNGYKRYKYKRRVKLHREQKYLNTNT